MQGKNANRDKKQSGGLVRGPGTGTSDSIQKDVAPGSFIMPADSTQALGLGQKMPVNLSNGEYELPPEQVHAVGIQALTNAKDATHTPVAEPRGLGRELFFANGGPVETPEQKAARLRATTPRQTSFDATNTPGAMKAEIVSRKDAGLPPIYQQRHPQPHPNQFDEKRSRELLAQNKKQPDQGAYGLGDRAADFVAGTAKAAAGGLAMVPAAAVDYGRQGLAMATDSTLTPEQQTQARDAAGGLLDSGLEQRNKSFDGASGLVSSAIGATPNDPAAGIGKPLPSQLSVPVQPNAGQDPTATQQAPAAGLGDKWASTGVGGAVTRVGANGVQEFSNDPNDTKGAAAMPAGGVGTMGDGKGTFSVMGQEGDAQRAIATYDRANEQRRQMIASAQKSELGNNGGQVSVVRDSTRMPTQAELVNDRLEQNQARGLRADQQLRQTQSRANQQAAENSAKHQQDMEIGGLGLNANRQLEAIKEQLANPNIPEDQRKQLLETYNTLTISAKDRYMEIRGGENQEGNQQASTYLDKATGRQGGGSQSNEISADQRAIAIRDNPNLSRDQKAEQLKALGYN